MAVKGSLRIAVSAFLLLCFSAAVIPLDFLHSHSPQKTCSDVAKYGSCQHKHHLTKKTYCFACNAHFEKNFTTAQLAEYAFIAPLFIQFCAIPVKDYNTKSPLSFLRGPPFI